MPDADLSLAVPAVFFGAVGTAGQRCTSTRRLYLHTDIADEFIARLQRAYGSVRPGDPLDTATLLGPVHTRAAVDAHARTIAAVRAGGGAVLAGGEPLAGDALAPGLRGGNWCAPTLVRPGSTDHAEPVWAEETFAPVLSVATFDTLPQAVAWNNGVRQGLSSSLWTRDVRNVGAWIGPAGSDCGIVNVSCASPGDGRTC
jgi:aldehyde dehydrogenase family 7 protein A1